MSLQDSDPIADDHYNVNIEGLKMLLNKALLEGRQPTKYYYDIGTIYYQRYTDMSQQNDLKSAIAFYKSGLDSCTSDTWYQSDLCSDLGSALRTQYELFGNLDSLEEATMYYRRALSLSPDQDDRFNVLNKLAVTLWDKYQNLGEIETLEEAIAFHEEALDLCPPGHQNRYMTLGNFASALQSRYEQLGEINDLEQAITYFEQALELCDPSPSAELDSSLNNIGTALQGRYLELGKIDDLERAIMYHKQALDLCVPGHPNSSGSLINLANALQTRYEQLGEMEDLQKSIAYCEQGLDLCPPGHPSRPISLNNLANSLQARYDQLGEMKDLEKAISCNEQALKLHPPGHFLTSGSFNNLGNALQSRFDQVGEIEDLERAIVCHEQALNLHPPGHPDRAMSLNNLANALQTRYRSHGEKEDLEKTILCHQQALELCPLGHPSRPLSLHNLANALHSRYEQLEDIQDLESTISCHSQALDLYPHGHPNRSTTFNNLANTFYNRYYKLNDMEDLETAISYNQQAAFATTHLPQRLIGAKQWAIKAHIHGFSSAISAYSLALELLQQHLALLPSLTSQQKLVEKSSHLSLDAAACAIGTDATEMAIQFLEQGRSILWSKIQIYRQSLADLSKKAPHLANEFQTVSNQLEHNATSDSVDLTLQHALSKKWTTLLGDIRKLDGFSNYLQATPFDYLKQASVGGPVIMINVSQYGSDAIILVNNVSPVVVPLPDASPSSMEELVHQLSNATVSASPSRTVYWVLQQLWGAIVSPVVAHLVQLGIPERSHIWWCPTSFLCALPLHAAGPYRRGLKNLPDLYICSYTPTLSSLIRARSNIPKPQPLQSLLLISQPDDTLPHVFEETVVIKSFGMQVHSCSGYNADKKEVLESLQSHPWAHFACHGHLEAQPFNSWFQLYNGEHLTVLDLMKAQLPNAEFAFLSACHSAAGDVHGTPDESIHLAGALQFSGFRSVIGTLWAMVDDDGPPIANAFYKYMFRNPGNFVDLTDAGEALNIATKELRRQSVPVERWINFVHIGA